MYLKTIAGVSLAIFLLAERAPAADIVDYASRYIGRPYVWGAEGPSTFDCSGLTQYVFGKFDVELPRRAVDQSRVGNRITRRLERGDLVFFSTDTRKSLVTHVGIYEGRRMMIEASKSAGRVRRSNLDDAYWTDRFMFARRVLPGAPGAPTRDRRAGDDRDRSTSKGKQAIQRAAVRALEELAGTLLRRPK
jgi:hypothetical protein